MHASVFERVFGTRAHTFLWSLKASAFYILEVG